MPTPALYFADGVLHQNAEAFSQLSTQTRDLA